MREEPQEGWIGELRQRLDVAMADLVVAAHERRGIMERLGRLEGEIGIIKPARDERLQSARRLAAELLIRIRTDPPSRLSTYQKIAELLALLDDIVDNPEAAS